MEDSQIVLSGKVKDSGDSARVCTKTCTNWFFLLAVSFFGKKQEYVDRNVSLFPKFVRKSLFDSLKRAKLSGLLR